MQRRQLMHAAAATLASSVGMTAHSQTATVWPDRPVKFILSQPPGSGPDNVALDSFRLNRYRCRTERLANVEFTFVPKIPKESYKWQQVQLSGSTLKRVLVSSLLMVADRTYSFINLLSKETATSPLKRVSQ